MAAKLEATTPVLPGDLALTGRDEWHLKEVGIAISDGFDTVVFVGTIIRQALSATKVLHQIPARYRHLLPPREPQTGKVYALLLFPCDREDVIISSAVRHAMEDLRAPGPEQRVIAVGGNFTAEALAYLEMLNAIVLRLSDFHWTDEGYKEITGAA